MRVLECRHDEPTLRQHNREENGMSFYVVCCFLLLLPLRVIRSSEQQAIFLFFLSIAFSLSRALAVSLSVHILVVPTRTVIALR